MVAGQSVASLAVDRAGIGPAGPQALTGRRVVGAVLTVVAVIVAVADRLGHTERARPRGAAGGRGRRHRMATGGQRSGARGGRSVPAATLVNFIVGTTALALAFGVDFAIRGQPTGALPSEPWLYLGGSIGVVFIAIAAAIVRYIGVLLLGLSMVAGQLVGALGIDMLAPGGSGRPNALTLIGVALTLIAVVIAATGSANLHPPANASEVTQ